MQKIFYRFLMTSTLLFCYKLDTTLVAISCVCYYWAHPLAASWLLRAVSANTNTNTNIDSCLCYYWAHPLAASWPLRAARTQSFASCCSVRLWAAAWTVPPFGGSALLRPLNAWTPFWRALQSFELQVTIQLVRSPVSMKSESDLNLPNLFHQSAN